jgi:hypothetical protein
MSMTGGISFYDKSKSLYKDGASAVASSNTAAQNLCLGTNKYFKWISSGSDDSTIETLVVTLPNPVEISRLFLIDHNLKAFTIKYGAMAGSNFSNVVGLDSYSDSKIQLTACARNASYFEFTPVTTDRLILTMTTTQTANAEKYLNQFIVTNELGTLEGYPKINGVTLDRNARREEAISGRFQMQKSYEVAGFDLSLSTYPKQDDLDLLDSLHEREEPFLCWLCGGLPDQFRLKQRGFREKDLYQMQIDKALRNSYEKNVYIMGVNQSYSFLEVV